jgi:hypothetical protein
MHLNNSIKILKLLYLLLLLSHPILFLKFFETDYFGFNISISRILEVVCLIICIFNWKKFIKSNNDLINYITLTFILFYTFISIIALITGLIYRSYDLSYMDLNGIGVINFSIYIKFLFNYFYFSICLFLYFYLPYILLNSNDIIKFFKLIKFQIYLILLIGFFQLIFGMFDYNLIPRDLSSDIYINDRFTSLLGEPRDAFIFLIYYFTCLLILVIIGLMSIIEFFIVSSFILLALILTSSFSGFISVCLFIFIFFIKSFFSKNKKNIYYIIILLILLIILSFTEHINNFIIYFISFDINELNSKLILGQLNNILPILALTEANFIQLIFGHGPGTSSIYNYNNGHWLLLVPPHSFFITSIFELGLISILFFIFYFYYLYINIVNNNLHPNNLFLKFLSYCFMFLFIASMIHKSIIFFLILFLFIAIYKIYEIK